MALSFFRCFDSIGNLFNAFQDPPFTMRLLIIVLFTGLFAGKEPVIRYTHQTYNAGFCSDQYYFYSDHFLLYNRGCEGRNHLLFGKWQQFRDSIRITFSDTLNYELIASAKYELEDSLTDQFYIQVTDCYERPVSAAFWCFQKSVLMDVRRSGDYPAIVIAQTDSINGKVQPFIRETVNGKLVVKRTEYDSVQLMLQQQLNTTTMYYSFPANKNTLKIRLTVPAEAFQYPLNHWIYNPVETKFSLNALTRNQN